MAELRLAQITKSYDTKQVLAPTDLSVADGSFCALLGPSGSGKTTLLRIIAGLADPDSGRIRIGDHDVTDTAPNRRNIGFVFQNYALFPHMSVADNVAFGLRMRSVSRAAARAKATDMLRLVGLNGMADRRPAQLSGGQQQRVALARALVFEPELLLLDEPLSALDRKIREEMQGELKRVHRETGLTTIIVTHDQDEALDLSDQVLLLDGGRIQQAGSPVQMYREPNSMFVADFLGAQSILPGTLVSGPDGWRVEVGSVSLPVRATEGAAHGTAVTVAVQPECVTVRPDTDPQPGDLFGEVRNLEFYGSLARASVQLDTSVVLPTMMFSTTAVRLSEGSRVTVTVDPAGVHAFPAEAAV
jgi:ABC-type Fe3+/spermidine/putrescine transport system ATPase subunit